MPILPRKNNLDYQPDNIIQASKRLTTIALSNMKNPLTDPDEPALNALSNQKSLNGSMNEFSKLLLQLQTSFIRAKQEGARLVSIFEGRVRREDINQMMGQFSERQQQTENFLDELQNIARMRGEGRTKGAKDKVPRKSKKKILKIENGNPNIQDFFRNRSYGTTEINSIRSAEPVGRYGTLPLSDYSNRMISNGAVADAEVEDVDDEMSDLDMSSIVSSRRGFPNGDDDSSSSSSSNGRGGFPDGGWDDGDGDDTNSSHYPIPPDILDFNDENPEKTLSNLLLDITKQIRYMDLLLISNIKPMVQQLTSQQLSTLSSAYSTLTSIWNDFQTIEIGNTTLRIVDYMKDVVQFGSQIFRILEEELNKLKIDLLIVVNSYKQNEAVQQPNFTPDSFWENSAVREMEGAGRTFTGKNTSCRDIPTIWRGAQRECAYKYML